MSSNETTPEVAITAKRFNKLVGLLRELFQLDQPELDFGIYRIMRAKSDEITQFLERDLLPQVKSAFEEYHSDEVTILQRELEEAIQRAKDLGVDPDSVQKVKNLRARIAAQSIDVAALEADVYDHLYRFFRRYYHEGDFISRRVYKEGVYAIPYEGEEVRLCWANYDQYYIKTDEYLRDYAFRLTPQDKANPRRVHFRLVDAKEGEHGNVKESNKRVFILASEDFIAEENGELVIRFEYRPATVNDWWPEERRNEELAKDKPKPPSQKDLLDIAEQHILESETPELKGWLEVLKEPHIKANGEQADYTRLRAHLNRYTARNTFDYFIHKDLGGFLRRELDFYIKNEVMHLDDIENETTPRVEQYLSKIKVIRKIAHKIIDFLAQLEDFQKKLWEKKKFVTETFYCITVGNIPEAFYPEIAGNEAQWEEWRELFHIHELPDDLFSGDLNTNEGRIAFLKAHPTLVLDTRHFPQDFTDRLLASFDDLDDMTDGLLVHSENWQALNLMLEKYRDRVKTIYIDPPYNTGNDEFLYRDNYQHSSWLAMMYDRLALGREWMREDGAIFVSIDRNERDRLTILGQLVFGPEWYLNTFVWINNLKGRQISSRGAAGTHEYVLAFGGQNVGTFAASVVKLKNVMPSAYKGFDYEIREDDFGLYVLKNELYNTNSKFNEETRPNLVFNIHYNFATGEIRFSDIGDEIEFEGFVKIPPKQNHDGVHQYHAWRWGKEKILKEKHNLEFVKDGDQVRIYTKVRDFEATALKDVITDISTSLGAGGVSALFGAPVFMDYPKPVSFVEIFASQAGPEDLIADYFAGSGTTGHAVINLNREDGGRRKFILVEMADYFDTVLLPRLKKVTFAPEWKSGKPKRLPTPEEAERSPRIMKVVRLESYEDTLNNLELRRTKEQESLFAKAEKDFYEEYVLKYMLNVESRGSASLLNVGAFLKPTQYTLKVKQPGSDESREIKVDLVETFNWLIGLHVHHISPQRRFSASFERAEDPDLPENAPRRLIIKDRLREDPTGKWWFRTVEGETRDGRKVLVIWRNRPGGEEPEGVEQDNLVLDEWFTKQRYSSKDSEFDLIYVNGTNNLENLKTDNNDIWKVRLIEEDFLRRMFGVEQA